MKIQNFLFNVLKLAKSPSVENLPVLDVDKKDMKEIIAFLDDNSIWYTANNEQELTFKWADLNFTVVENDKAEDVALDGRVVEPAKFEAVLSEEDQVIADRNTDAAGEVAPLPEDDIVEVARENSETLTDEEFAEQAQEREANKPKTIIVDHSKKKAGKKVSV